MKILNIKQSSLGLVSSEQSLCNFYIVSCCIAIKLYAIYCFCQNCSIVTNIGKVRIAPFFIYLFFYLH